MGAAALFLVVGTRGAPAAEAALVRVEFQPPDPVWVGQQVVFYVEVLTNTSFSEPPRSRECNTG